MSKKTAVLVTLGHHASAIYFDGEKAVGFEEERLTRRKAESRYPVNALEKLEKHCDIEAGSNIFVCHWFDVFRPEEIPDGKYFDRSHFTHFVKKHELVPSFVSSFGTRTDGKFGAFTHHDAHAWSGLAFFWDKLTPQQKGLAKGDDVHVIVLDGFGNWQEAISIYQVENGAERGSQPELIRRVWGYERSMGLMYQYATSYCEMKENQDEYKFLGYESHVHEVLPEETCHRLVELATAKGLEVFKSFLSVDVESHTFNRMGPTGINTTDLVAAKEKWHAHFDAAFRELGLDPAGMTARQKRIVVGNYVQTIVESVMVRLIERYNMKHVVVAGGVFYNVKLNNRFLKHVPGLFSVVPLAGDQGCAIGMYEQAVGGFRYGDLKWSPRDTLGAWQEAIDSKVSSDVIEQCVDLKRVKYFTDREEFVEATTAALREDRIVNVIDGNMEYGPRALCSTTTLAYPSQRNVETINALNDRDTVMPMAPVIPFESASRYFDPYDFGRVVGSDRFMIITYDYVSEVTEANRGVAHPYPTSSEYVGKFSGRPQFVCDVPGDRTMRAIFAKLDSDVLINTSFNAHGRPIVYDVRDVMDSYVFQVAKALELGLEVPLLHILDETEHA